MAIHFHLKSRTQNTPTAVPDGGAVQNTARPNVSTLSAKAAELLERTKLMHTISDLEDEIALQMCTIGELVYATHRGNPSDTETMQKILEYVDDLEDELEGHEKELKMLMGITSCPVCDEDVCEDDVFCQKCGQALPLSEES